MPINGNTIKASIHRDLNKLLSNILIPNYRIPTHAAPAWVEVLYPKIKAKMKKRSVVNFYGKCIVSFLFPPVFISEIKQKRKTWNLHTIL